MNTDNEQRMLKAFLIREVEENLLSLFSQGKLFGTTHTCVGQELAAIALAEHCNDEDVIFSNHRCHGHYIARTDDVEGLIAEIMGKSTGVCAGFGGSQHLCGKMFFSNGVQGGILPVAAGYALGQRLAKSDALTIACIGDGTLGEGIVYETMNIASKWHLPLLIFLEDNGYAQSTSKKETLAGLVIDRAKAFGISTFQCSIWDFEALLQMTEEAFSHVRDMGVPAFVCIESYRLRAHSKGDDNRDQQEIQHYSYLDPLRIFYEQNKDNKHFIAALQEIKQRVRQAIVKAEAAGFAVLEDIDSSFYHEFPIEKVELSEERQVHAINCVLDALLHRDRTIILLGEDIRDDYGGAFKVTKGLSNKYFDRVLNTPISEAAVVGIGNGLALSGYKPIVEIMFGDFITLAFDQIVNHASKFRHMYNNKVNVPIIIRTPMGGGRGYGATHSQCLDKFLAGIPNIRLIILHGRARVKYIYVNIIGEMTNPTIIIEHKLLYNKRGNEALPVDINVFETKEKFPTTILRFMDPPDITIVAFGFMSFLAEEAASFLYEQEEVVTELLFPLQISPINIAPIVNSVKKTKKLLIIEESTATYNLGSEVIAQIHDNWIYSDPFHVRRIATKSVPIPSSGPLEKSVLPSLKEVLQMARELFYV